MTSLEIAFWVCAALVAYVYAGYAALAALVSLVTRRAVIKSPIEPSVTVVISAYNEAREIEATVLNKLAQDYPPDRLGVLVISDASTDGTDEIVRRLAHAHRDRLRFLRQEPRQGKTAALNLALGSVESSIVVFADANSVYAPDAIRKLVRNFADPSVGYVTGRMCYAQAGQSGIGEGSSRYMSYENALRAVETRLGSIVGVDGGIDAIRRELYARMAADQLPDFVLPLHVVEQGRRVVYEPEALVFEPALADPRAEFRMRVRVALRALWALYDKRALFNPLRFPLFSWQLTSHKLLRYFAFLPLLGLLITNIALATKGSFYSGFLTVQLLAYLSAAFGAVLHRRTGVPSLMLLPYYFVILNAACGLAAWKMLNGERMAVWTPRQGA